MRFRIEHTFNNITPETYEHLLMDDAHHVALCEEVKLARRLVSKQTKGNVIHRVIAMGPDREIPPPAAKILGANRIEYTEHFEYELGSRRGTWHTVPSLMASRIETKGTLEFFAEGKGVRRVVHGEIRVKLMGVGGLVEKMIVGDIEKSYDRAAAFTQRWIDSGKAKTDENSPE